jgi:hypothetical protein
MATPAADVPPILDTLALFADASIRENGTVFGLVQPLHTVLVQPDANSRFPVPRFCLYAAFTDLDARGTFQFAVEIWRGNLRIYEPEGFVRAFAPRAYPVNPLEHVFWLNDLVLPEPGEYHFHVTFGKPSDDRQSRLSLCERSGNARFAKLIVVPEEAPAEVLQ